MKHSVFNKIGISKAMSICIDHGIRVYPICSGGRYMKIQVFNNGRKHTYPDNLVKIDDINRSITEKYLYYSREILKKIKSNSI